MFGNSLFASLSVSAISLPKCSHSSSCLVDLDGGLTLICEH